MIDNNSGTDNSPKYLIFILSIIHFLLGFDINIVSISLPSIATYFNTTPNDISSIVWVYFLIITCFLLFFGKFGDEFGFKKLYLSGITLFTLGSLLCAFSPSIIILVSARVVQAIGAAVLFALTPAIISAYIPENIRGRAYGINYSFVAIGGVIGRAGSGYLIGNFGWQSIFIINILVGIFAIYTAYKLIPNKKPEKNNKPFDYIGTVLIFIALLSLLFAINKVNEFGISSLYILVSLAAAIIFGILFLYRQKVFSNPLFHFSILKNKNLSIHFILFFLIYIITNGTIFLFPFYLLSLKVFSVKDIGLMMTVPSLMQMFSGYLSGILSDKIKPKIILIIGFILILISYVGYTFLNYDSSINFILITMAVYGFGIGFSIPVNTKSVMSYSSEDNKGSVSSFMTTIIRTGSAFGVCLFAAINNYFTPVVNDANIMVAFRNTFIFGAAVAVTGFIILLFLKEKE